MICFLLIPEVYSQDSPIKVDSNGEVKFNPTGNPGIEMSSSSGSFINPILRPSSDGFLGWPYGKTWGQIHGGYAYLERVYINGTLVHGSDISLKENISRFGLS